MFDNEPAGVRHPLNRKVTCSFYLRDLQEQTGLSDDALQHIARILGPRCASSVTNIDQMAHRSTTKADCASSNL